MIDNHTTELCRYGHEECGIDGSCTRVMPALDTAPTATFYAQQIASLNGHQMPLGGAWAGTSQIWRCAICNEPATVRKVAAGEWIIAGAALQQRCTRQVVIDRDTAKTAASALAFVIACGTGTAELALPGVEESLKRSLRAYEQIDVALGGEL